MKKLTLLFLIIAAVFSFSACGTENASKTDKDKIDIIATLFLNMILQERSQAIKRM